MRDAIFTKGREITEHQRTLAGINPKLPFAQKLRDRISTLKAEIKQLEEKRGTESAYKPSSEGHTIQDKRGPVYFERVGLST